ncbi:MAG: Na(+)-translocating NADH-quinone reductase subunit A [Bacteroidales bacterium]|nr:Na(+)-translocating NADH-quinone reductase subunit A [Bacteroidales bacterium]
MPHIVKLKKGFDIRIKGVAEKKLAGFADPAMFGLKPVDFPGLTPKLNVKEGSQVLAGAILFHDKLRPEIRFTSPVSGKVVAIERGDRRKILQIVIEKEGNESIDFGKFKLSEVSGEMVKDCLLASGLWPSIRQRPYHIVANPHNIPKSVFVTGFDSSPLAPDYDFILENSKISYYRTGLFALTKLANGSIKLILKDRSGAGRYFSDIPGIEIHYFSGPHPSGNPGVHIHHIDPVNKGEVVWYTNLQDVSIIGRLLEEGIYRPEKIVALTGSEVINKQYYRMLAGGSVASMAEGNVRPGNLRYISGNVLTGTRIKSDGYLGYYDSQVTVIPEGDYHEFFGWASPGASKFSFYRTYLSSLFPRKEYQLDTNLHGGERAFVVTGQYEKVLPMDIFPMQLLKAILAGDIDMMENLGIYEVAEEDLALCEYICPSKIEIQSIIRKGIDLMIKEMS